MESSIIYIWEHIVYVISEPATPLARDADQHPRHEIRVLIVDDSEDDALAVVNELKRGGYSPTFERVDTADAMISALKNRTWDVIISDYVMPSFSGLAALNLSKASGLNLPFILVSGKVGEDKAVEAMKAGATDYVMKDKLNRLVSAIERELGEAKVQRERRKAEEAIHRQEQRFRALIEHSSDVIVILSAEGKVRYVSASAEPMLGFKPKEATGNSILKSVHPDDIQLLADNFASLLQDPSATLLTEVRVQHKDGNWHTLEATATNLLHDPAVEGIVVNLRDITDRKQAEEAISESETRLATIFENDATGKFIVDSKTHIIHDANRSALEAIGLPKGDVIGRVCHRFICPAEAGRCPVCDLGQTVDRSDRVLLKPDGTRVPILKTVAPIKLKGKDYLLESFIDVTERKKAEEAIAESEKRYRLLAENASDVIWVTDMNMRPTYLSPSITRLLGYSMEEAMARGMQDSLTPASLKAAADAVTSALDAERKGQKDAVSMMPPLELEMVRKDGSIVWVASTVSFIRGPDGQPMEMMGVLRDITERKKVEESLQESESRQKLAVRTLESGIWELNVKTGKAWRSLHHDQIFGYTTLLPEWTYQMFLDHVIPEDRSEVDRKYGSALSTKTEWAFECRIRKVDNTVRWIWAQGKPSQYDDKHEVVVISGIVKDITERKQAEEALRKSHQLLNDTGEMAEVGGWELDLSTSEVSWTEETCRIHGVGPGYRPKLEEALDFYAPESRSDVAAAVKKTSETGEPWDIESLFMPRGSKDKIWVRSLGKAVYSGGEIVRLAGTFQNIDKYKRAEESLRDSESHYRLLAENLSDVIWIMDTNFRYSYLSPSITRLQGYTVEEAMAQPLEENLTPASLEYAMRIMAEEDAKDHTGKYDPNRTVTMEVELYRKDGSTVWVENVASYLRDSKGQITGYLGVSREITERRESRKQLEQSFRKLEKTMDGTIQAITLTVESRDRFTAGHQKRVAQLACAIAQEMGFTSEQIQAIRIAGLLHDIGKISVPQEILTKPGSLTDIEFQLIKAHSQTGYDILKTVEFPWPIADIVIQHHERMNGSGYPSGIREDKLLIEARILGVADVVEAMSSHRPYRVAPGVDKALEEISRNSGILYDPNVVNACLRLFEEKGFSFES